MTPTPPFLPGQPVLVHGATRAVVISVIPDPRFALIDVRGRRMSVVAALLRPAAPAATFGAALKERRLAAGMTMGKLARAVGWTVAQISRVENDKSAPPPHDEALRLALIVGCDPEPLLALLRATPEVS